MAQDMTIGLKIEGQQIDQTTKQVKELNKELGNVGKNASNSASGQSSKALNEVAKASDEFAKSAKKAGKEADNLGKKQTALTKVKQDLGNEAKRLAGSVGSVGRIFGSLASGATAALNPIALVGAAAVGLTAAFLAGQRESQMLNAALVNTGNIAGQTASQLQSMSAAIASSVGTQAQAADAIAQLVNTGQYFGDSLGQYAETAVRAQRELGQSVDQTVTHFEALAKSPVQASLALNEQMNYLTTSVYEQIRALEEQGKVQEAAKLAMDTYAEAMESRGAQVEQRLGSIQKAWRAIKDTASDATDSLLSIGREQTKLEEATALLMRISDLEDKINQPTYDRFGNLDQINARRRETLAVLKAQHEELIKQIYEEQKQAKIEGERVRFQKQAISAADDFYKARQAALTNEQRMTAEMVKQLNNLMLMAHAGMALSATDVDAVFSSIKEKYTPKPVKVGGGAKVDQVGAAYDQQQLAMTTQLLQLQQQLENAQNGVADSQNAATNALEIWLKTNEHAQKMDAARIQSLRDMAAEVDATQQQLRDATENREREKRIESGLRDVQLNWLQVTGKAAEASAMQIEARFKKLREDLAATGNTEGLGMVDSLAAVQKAQAELQQIQQQAQQALTQQNQQEQSIQLRLQSNLITEFEARRQIVDVHKQTADELDKLIPKMRELATITGSQEALNQIEALSLQMQTLRQNTNEVALAFGETFENRFSETLKALVDHTKTLGEAVKDLMLNMVQDMGKWAAGELANEAKSGVMKMFGSAFGSASDTASKTAETAATTASTTALTAMSGSATATTGALTALAAAATAAAAAQTSNAAGSAAGSILGSIAGSGFATGGHVGGYTGPGGKYQVAGIVHKDEYVLRKEVVNSPGVMRFLNVFNQHGLGAALASFRLPGYANGGLVTASAPAYQPTDSSALKSTTLDNKVNVMLLDDPNRITEAMMTADGQRNFLKVLQRNQAAARQVLGV